MIKGQQHYLTSLLSGVTSSNLSPIRNLKSTALDVMTGVKKGVDQVKYFAPEFDKPIEDGGCATDVPLTVVLSHLHICHQRYIPSQGSSFCIIEVFLQNMFMFKKVIIF